MEGQDLDFNTTVEAGNNSVPHYAEQKEWTDAELLAELKKMGIILE